MVRQSVDIDILGARFSAIDREAAWRHRCKLAWDAIRARTALHARETHIPGSSRAALDASLSFFTLPTASTTIFRTYHCAMLKESNEQFLLVVSSDLARYAFAL